MSNVFREPRMPRTICRACVLLTRGNVILKIVLQKPHPSILAASYISPGMREQRRVVEHQAETHPLEDVDANDRKQRDLRVAEPGERQGIPLQPMQGFVDLTYVRVENDPEYR